MSLSVPVALADGNDSADPAAVATAFAAGSFQYVWELAWAMETRLSGEGRWLDVIATQKLALAAAVRLDDWMLQGYSHLALGRASLAVGDHRRARQQLAEGTYMLHALGIHP